MKREKGQGKRDKVRGMNGGSSGLTMIETLVWIFLFIAAMSAVVLTLVYFYRTNLYSISQASAISSAQRGLEQVVRTIREGAYSSEGAFPIVSIAANDFVFYADIDTDSLIERVHYYISGSNLVRGIIEPTGNPPAYTSAEATSTIAQYVRNVDQGLTTFRYYDELGSEIVNYANWTAVRFVKVALTIDVDPIKLPDGVTFGSSTAIRNLIGK